MNQLFMRLNGPAHATAAPMPIVDTASPGFTPEAFADGWALCCEELNGGLWPREKFEREMRGDPKIKDDGILFAATPENELIATAAVQFGRAHTFVPAWDYAQSTTLHMVGTRRGFNGRGAGLAVCAAAVAHSLRQGVDTMYLTTDDFRLPAVKIYLKLGFSPVLHDIDQHSRWQALATALGRDISCVTPDEHTIILHGGFA